MPPFTATLAQDPTQLRGLRHSLAAWLENEAVSAASRDPIVIATHEAAANAIKHGELDLPVTVTATHDPGDNLTVVVRNEPKWRESEPEFGRRGLSMMRELMSEVRSTTTVRMRSDL